MMRKIILFLAVAMFTTVASAQFKVGGGVVLGTKAGYDEGGSKMGIGVSVRGDYAINDLWAVAPDFTFFFPGSPSGIDVTLWQLNANAHYNLSQMDGFLIYGLAGLNYSHRKIDLNFDDEYLGSFGSFSDDEVGLNLGAGANYNQFFGELKYDTAFEQIAISVGILFGT